MKNKTKFKSTYKPATLQERFDFVCNAVKKAIESHGSPCCCLLCEALIFSYMASLGEVNLKPKK